MVRVICPICRAGVDLEEVPSRLPVSVPSHADATGATCHGTGVRSRDAWIVRPALRHVPTA